MSSHRTPVLYVLMTRSAEDERLAMASGHHSDPLRLFAACVLVEVLEGPNVVHLDLVCQACGSALLADLCEKSLFEFRPLCPNTLWLLFKVCFNVPLQGDSTPGCYQRFLSFP